MKLSHAIYDSHKFPRKKLDNSQTSHLAFCLLHPFAELTAHHWIPFTQHLLWTCPQHFKKQRDSLCLCYEWPSQNNFLGPTPMGDSSNCNVWKLLSQKKSRTETMICRLKGVHWPVMVCKLHAYYNNVLKNLCSFISSCFIYSESIQKWQMLSYLQTNPWKPPSKATRTGASFL